MNKLAYFSRFAAASLACSSLALAQGWNEGVNGDLSNDPANPTSVSLSTGINMISGTVGDADTRDYVTFTIPAGQQLVSMRQIAYVDVPAGTAGNTGYHCLNNGSTSQVPGPGNSSFFLGGDHVNQLPVGTDMLPALAAATLAGTGFSAPLGAGTYCYLIQQTGTQVCAYELSFDIAPLQDWNESTAGDLSDDHVTPTATALSVGTNTISGTVGGLVDVRDYMTFTIPTGQQLVAIRQMAFVDVPAGTAGNTAYNCLNDGPTSEVPGAGNSSFFLGGDHVNQLGIGADMLPALAAATLAGTGFSTPLGAGTYTYLIQQTGPQVCAYELKFDIETAKGWNEATDGDLSDNSAAPSTASLGIGTNTISGTVGGLVDVRDYMTFTIPAGQQLVALRQLSWLDVPAGTAGNTGYHSIDGGSTSLIPGFTNSAFFLGGDHVDQLAVGTDMLPALAAGNLAGVGFSNPLGQGTYTYLVQQTGPQVCSYEFSFDIAPVKGWSEATDGDLSDDPATPTAATLSAGTNTVAGTVGGLVDVRDYMTFTIPAGQQLVAMRQMAWVDVPAGTAGNTGYHSLNNGATSQVPDASNGSFFLGGDHVNQLAVGTDMLPALAGATLAGTGFSLPLGAGTYTYLIQQTGPQLCRYELEFEIGNANTNVLAAGSLANPFGLLADAQGRLWIGEAGTGSGNTGQVSRYDPSTTTLQAVLTGFASVTSPEGSVNGVHHLAWDAQQPDNLIIAQGVSTGVVQTWNTVTSTLVQSHDVRTFVLAQGLPDSNVYSVASMPNGDLYVADAGANAIIKIDNGGVLSIFAELPNLPNLAPPFIGQQAVPTKILADGNGGFWVCNLTGGPFFSGVASVFHIDATGSVTTVQTGFTTLVDASVDPKDGHLAVLSFAEFDTVALNFAPNSGTIHKLDPANPYGTEFVAGGLMLPTGLAYTQNGDLYVHSYALGSLEQITTRATATSYGAGCPGSNGIPALTATNLPELGATYSLALGNLDPTASVALIVTGLSRTTSSQGPLPLSLQPFGLGADCNLLTSADNQQIIPVTTSQGTYDLTIPSTLDLRGLPLHNQVASIDPIAPGGIAMSNAVRAIVGQ